MSGSRWYEAGRDPGLYEATGPCSVQFQVDHKIIWEKQLRAGDRFLVHGQRSPMRAVHELLWETPGDSPPVRVVDQYRASPGNVLAAMTLVDAFEFLDRAGRRQEWTTLRGVCDEIARLLEQAYIPGGPAATAPLPAVDVAPVAADEARGAPGRRLTMRPRPRMGEEPE